MSRKWSNAFDFHSSRIHLRKTHKQFKLTQCYSEIPRFLFLFLRLLSNQTSFKKNERRPRRVPGCVRLYIRHHARNYRWLVLEFSGSRWRMREKWVQERGKTEIKVVSERAVRSGAILYLKLYLTEIDGDKIGHLRRLDPLSTLSLSFEKEY